MTQNAVEELFRPGPHRPILDRAAPIVRTGRESEPDAGPSWQREPLVETPR